MKRFQIGVQHCINPYVVLSLVLAMMLSVALNSILSAVDASERLVMRTYDVIIALNRIRDGAFMMESGLGAYATTGDRSHLQRWRRGRDLVRGNLILAYEKTDDNSPQQHRFPELIKILHEDFDDLRQRAFNAAEKGNLQERVATRKKISEHMDRVDRIIDSMIDYEKNFLSQKGYRIDGALKIVRYIITAIPVLAAVFCLVFLFRSAKHIEKPLTSGKFRF